MRFVPAGISRALASTGSDAGDGCDQMEGNHEEGGEGAGGSMLAESGIPATHPPYVHAVPVHAYIPDSIVFDDPARWLEGSQAGGT